MMNEWLHPAGSVKKSGSDLAEVEDGEGDGAGNAEGRRRRIIKTIRRRTRKVRRLPNVLSAFHGFTVLVWVPAAKP